MAQKYQVFCASVTIETGVNDVIIFDEGGSNLVATVDPGTFYPVSTAASDSLLKEVDDALTASGALGYSWAAWTLSQSSSHSPLHTGTINASGSYQLQFAHASMTFDSTALGFTAADTGSATGHTADQNSSLIWIPTQPRVLVDPGAFEAPVSQHVAADGSRYTFRAAAVREMRRFEFQNEQRARTFVEAEATTADSFEAFWRVIRDGRPFRVYELEAATSTTLAALTDADLLGTFKLTGDSCASWEATRPVQATALYQWLLNAAVNV